jgi:LysR family hydrogen peroxide-inducible transcriptional activator
MNLQQLEYIVALDKYKNFSKAAESCFITQATLSTMVKRLEEELDVVIFDRKTTPILTTECGRELIDEAKKVLFHSARFKELSSEAKGRIEGELKIGIIPTVAGNLIHRISPTIMSKFPLLKLTITELTTNQIIGLLKNGELDIGIVSTPLQEIELEEKLLYYEKLMVYGSMDQKETHFLKPKDLANEKVWLLEQGNCLTDQIVNVCALQKKDLNTNFNFHPNTFESLLNIVDNLNGLTLIPEMYFMDMSAERKMKVKDFTSPFPVREISIVFHRPYAKLRLIEALAQEIERIIVPILATANLKSSEMLIAKMQ